MWERACRLENQETGSEKSRAHGRRVNLISSCGKAGTQAQDSKSSCSFTKRASRAPQLAHRETSHRAPSVSEDHTDQEGPSVGQGAGSWTRAGIGKGARARTWRAWTFLSRESQTEGWSLDAGSAGLDQVAVGTAAKVCTVVTDQRKPGRQARAAGEPFEGLRFRAPALLTGPSWKSGNASGFAREHERGSRHRAAREGGRRRGLGLGAPH